MRYLRTPAFSRHKPQKNLKMIREALKKGIDGDADVRMVQSILLTKIVEVAMSMGMSEEKFMKRARATWRLVEWHTEEFNDEQVH